MKPKKLEDKVESFTKGEPAAALEQDHYRWLIPGGNTWTELGGTGGAMATEPAQKCPGHAGVASTGMTGERDSVPAPASARLSGVHERDGLSHSAAAPPAAGFPPPAAGLTPPFVSDHSPRPGSASAASGIAPLPARPSVDSPSGGARPRDSDIAPVDSARRFEEGASSEAAISASVPTPNQTRAKVAPRRAQGDLFGTRADGAEPRIPAGVSPSDPAPGPGTRIGQYEVIRRLGSGGMGTVLLARDDRLGRRVAIKFLHIGNAEVTRRFIVEARATARCSHENIVVIYEVGEFRGSPFMVLEYLQGQTLASLLSKMGPMAPTRAVELTTSVVKALTCAHEQGIVHRDLKPENILLTDSGTLKVLDFGIAKVLKDEPRDADSPEDKRVLGLKLGGRSGIVGTMAYMSPEQWGVGGEVDHRTDIWATGIILFELLTGCHPFVLVGGDPLAWVTRLDVPMPSLHDVAPQIPAALADVVDRCVRKRKEERIPDAPSLLRALEPFLPGRYLARSVQIEAGPYAGLRSFEEEDAGRFFGRAREIAASVTRIRDLPLMAVVGPSGVGKSSFVRAGVVPALKSSGEPWRALVVRPGRDPLAALARLVEPLVGSSSTVVEDLGMQYQLAGKLAAEPGYLGSALRASARRGGERLLLFVDQFEELYTLGTDQAARRAFTGCLAAAADDATSPVRVVVSMRSDFLGRVAEDPHFMNELAKGLFFLNAPEATGLREALVEPAEMAGYRFETKAMVDEMLEYLESTPGALPLLQFTAAQLWERRDPARRVLTEQSYRALGGIGGALVTHADRVIAKLTPELRGFCRSLFLGLITPERTRAVRDLEELCELAPDRTEVERLVDHLVQSRLLVVQTSGASGGTSVEIVHESLIGNWPTLRRWLDESHEDSVFLEQLRAAARQWHTKARDGGLLWSGDMVEELRRFQRRYRGELPDIVKAFSAAVFDQHARGERRRRALLVAAVACLAMLLTAAAIALVVIRNAKNAAEKNATAAMSAEAAAQRRLHEVEEKERQRLQAESLRAVAEKAAENANTQLEATNQELEHKNVELTLALDHANEARANAQLAQERAETNEEKARKAADELEQLLQRERERANRLTQQLGSPIVETLR